MLAAVPENSSVSTANPSADPVVEIINPDAQGDFVLVCEHAGNRVPADLKNLGLPQHLLDHHAASDRGALDLATDMSIILDAPLIAQRVSGLVYDCNRRPADPRAIPQQAGFGSVPGNSGLTDEDRRSRVKRFYEPFCRTLSDCLKQRMKNPRQPILVSVHAFAPIVNGIWRGSRMGIMNDPADARLADAISAADGIYADLNAVRNEPAGPGDCSTHTLHEHALPRGLLNVMFLVRGDQVSDRVSQQKLATTLSRLLREAQARLENRVLPGPPVSWENLQSP